MRVRECEPVRACMHACVRDVFAIYDHNILPRLKMIIINIFILYFIQIRHTDDFPSTGTRLVIIIAIIIIILYFRYLVITSCPYQYTCTQ